MSYELIIYAPLLPCGQRRGITGGWPKEAAPIFKDLIAFGRWLENGNVFCILCTYTECVKSPPSARGFDYKECPIYWSKSA